MAYVVLSSYHPKKSQKVMVTVILVSLCPHLSHVLSPRAGGGSGLLGLRWAAMSALGSQSQNHPEAVLTSFMHILVQLKCSGLTSTSFPGEEKLSWCLVFSAVWMDCSVVCRVCRGGEMRWSDRDVSLTEMQMHNFRRLDSS